MEELALTGKEEAAAKVEGQRAKGEEYKLWVLGGSGCKRDWKEGSNVYRRWASRSFKTYR